MYNLTHHSRYPSASRTFCVVNIHALCFVINQSVAGLRHANKRELGWRPGPGMISVTSTNHLQGACLGVELCNSYIISIVV
jgi:hypothetical protein